MTRVLIRRPLRGDNRQRKSSTVAQLATAALGLSMVVAVAPSASAAPVTAASAPVAAMTSIAASTPDVPGRGSTTVNMFQWSWSSIARECTSTIGPAGYAFVQTSPPQEHVLGSAWWTAYQPVSYKIESRLGTRAQYKAMIDTCNAAGVKVIADTVINHMAGANVGTGTGWAGSAFGVDSFPGAAYGPNDFNDCKRDIANYSDRWEVQNCRLVSLQDLKTGSDYVRGKIAGYMNDLIGLGVAGFRIDAAKHIPATDLQAIKAKLTNPNVFWVQEVIGAAGEPIQPSEYFGSGDSHEFNYARTLKSRFDGQIAGLAGIANGLMPSANAGVFVDNHDTERNGETMNYKWGAKYKLANVFMLAYPYGSPSVYSGYTWDNKDAGPAQESNGAVKDADCANSAVWTCAHRWPEIKNMVKFRTTVGSTPVVNWWDDANGQIAFGRGDQGFVVINNEAGALDRTFQSSLPAGTYCNVVAGDGCPSTVTVNASGLVTVHVPAYGALAIHRGALGGPTPPSSTAKVFYATTKGWSTYLMHYRVGTGAWTTAPGVTMTAACTGWVTKEIDLGSSTGATAAFNNGAGTWDNNASADYTFGSGVVAIKDGVITTADPCGTTPPVTATTVFYSTTKGWPAYYIHYRIGSGAWTSAPGAVLAAACSGWVSKTISSTAGATVTAAFNNGSGTWDNNVAKDYSLSGGAVRVKDGVVTAGSPCA